jgi:hypothetical protein
VKARFEPWSAVKWSETTTKNTTKLVEPEPGAVEALGPLKDTPGTHTVTLEGRTIRLVAFSGRVKQVIDASKKVKTGVLNKVVIPMITSPVTGFLVGLTFMGSLYLFLRNWRPVTVNRLFGKLQIASSAYMGFSHGMNDATKCMGIITLSLVAGTKAGVFDRVPWLFSFLRTPEGSDPLHMSLGDKIESILPTWLQFGYMPNPVDPASQAVPDWVVIICALTIAAGTAVGGWRIIRTLGHKTGEAAAGPRLCRGDYSSHRTCRDGQLGNASLVPRTRLQQASWESDARNASAQSRSK